MDAKCPYIKLHYHFPNCLREHMFFVWWFTHNSYLTLDHFTVSYYGAHHESVKQYLTVQEKKHAFSVLLHILPINYSMPRFTVAMPVRYSKNGWNEKFGSYFLITLLLKKWISCVCGWHRWGATSKIAFHVLKNMQAHFSCMNWDKHYPWRNLRRFMELKTIFVMSNVVYQPLLVFRL